MNKSTLFILFALFATTFSCSSSNKKGDKSLVSIKTEFGEIKVKLYDETPLHKENFLKLVNEGFYNDLLFHRVINNFMIQGGDPDSKNAEAGKRLGGGSLGYTIPAEFVPKYFHKKGALAAARKGGPSNLEKRSSASQYYIVQGRIFSTEKLDSMEMMKNSRIKNDLQKKMFQDATSEINEFRNNNDQAGFNVFVVDLREKVDSIFEADLKFKFTKEQREIYTTIGGYPSLDGGYTVFGEVIEGLDVLDKISVVETDKYNRPLKDIKMEVEMAK